LPEEDDPTSAIGRGWKSTYLTDSREGAETALAALGYDWKWNDDGTLLTISSVLPAIRTIEDENKVSTKTFFNSIVAAYTGYRKK
jgi:hypothetical protein